MIVAGNNLHNQWNSTESAEYIFSVFRHIQWENYPKHLIDNIQLIEINWFYNVYKVSDSFYMSGFTNSTIKVREITLPRQCDRTDLLITGNDNMLFIVEKYKRTVWTVNLEDLNKFKDINLDIEIPIQSSDKKKINEDHVHKISSSDDSLLILTRAGNIYCGSLPSLVDTQHCIGRTVDVTCGYEHFVLLTDAGAVYTWGNGRRLQLGHGEISNQEIPTEVEALAGIKIKKISAGGWHTLALSEFGDLYAWGWNDVGQLGIRAHYKESYSLPTLVDIYHENTAIDLNIKDIACGTRHSAIILEDNSVWTSGNNKYGQLGLPSETLNIDCFRKVYQCDETSKLMCGPWTTVILN